MEYARTVEVVGADETKLKEQARITRIAPMAMKGPRGTRSSP